MANSFFSDDFSLLKLENIRSLFMNSQSVCESKDISFSSRGANQGIKQDRNLLEKNGTNKG